MSKRKIVSVEHKYVGFGEYFIFDEEVCSVYGIDAICIVTYEDEICIHGYAISDTSILIGEEPHTLCNMADFGMIKRMLRSYMKCFNSDIDGAVDFIRSKFPEDSTFLTPRSKFFLHGTALDFIRDLMDGKSCEERPFLRHIYSLYDDFGNRVDKFN